MEDIKQILVMSARHFAFRLYLWIEPLWAAVIMATLSWMVAVGVLLVFLGTLFFFGKRMMASVPADQLKVLLFWTGVNAIGIAVILLGEGVVVRGFEASFLKTRLEIAGIMGFGIFGLRAGALFSIVGANWLYSRFQRK